ncbi:MAG: hypothetical protein CFH32_00177 [Alphaproteobacteria bacterium MarineAlpha9_Bin2]|nr:MAG: hypothetical protein CFH32_00177 [Alphaproteobacteria bacterium MarineAlpha9_Bin2]
MTKNNLYVLLYIILIAIGIPWYWPQDSRSIILGVPAWVAVAVLCSLLASLLTAYILINSLSDEE